ncbi:MAG: helicase-related protein [Promethearchaeota archaeon]
MVHKFAPLSNPKLDNNDNVENMDKEDQLQLLISTDVLSEGQNLQDASVCINFDLHWNPVRIIQRVGRIDRLKSPHKNIQIFNAFPEEGLETLLSLVSRLVARLRLIDQTLELDGAILTGDELTKKSDQLSRLKKSDMSVLDELESEAELLGDDEVRDLLIKTMFVKGDKYFKTIPIGVHSGILKNEQHSGVAVVIRAFRKNIPSYLWGFEPDQPDEYSEFLKNGIVTSKAFIQNLIKCSENEDRYLPESENIDGDLFKRVMSIAFKLKQLLWASGVAKKIEEKLPEGNKIFFEHIKIAQKLGRKLPLKFPDISNVKKYIKLTKLSIIGKELDDLPKKYRIVIKNYKDSKKLKHLKERSQADKDFVNETIIFIKILDKYITSNKLLEKGEEKEIELKNKFELIGFLRIYNTDE